MKKRVTKPADFNKLMAAMPSLKPNSFGSSFGEFHWSPEYAEDGLVISRFSIAHKDFAVFLEFIRALSERQTRDGRDA